MNFTTTTTLINSTSCEVINKTIIIKPLWLFFIGLALGFIIYLIYTHLAVFGGEK